jgi:outer membrane protein TolC
LLGISGLSTHAAAQQDTASHVLTLGGAARLAARQNATALEAREEARQATARTHLSLGGFLPTIYGMGQETEIVQNSAALLRFPPAPPGSPFNFNAFLPPRGIDFPPIKAVDLRAYASDTLFSFAAIQRYRQSQAAERASFTAASSSAEDAAVTAATAYLNAEQAEAVLSARLADSALAADLFSIARQELAAGTGIALDVTRAQTQLASTRAQLISARSARDRTALDLLRAVNLSLDSHIVLSDSLSRMPVGDTVPAESVEIDRAMRQRPDLRALGEQLTAAQQAISAIRAERLPAVAAFANKGVQGGTWDRLLNVYLWGVGVSVPVFDGFRREARIEQQEALAREVDIRLHDLRQQAAVDVRRAFLDLASAREQLDAANQQLQLTQEELSEARERFRAGVAGNADVITASLDLNSARTLQVNALTNYQAARLSLARATGTVTELP